MKKALIIASILLIFILLVIFGFINRIFPWQSKSPSITPSTVPQPTSTPTSVTTTAPTLTPTPPPSQVGEVNFGFVVTDISGSGFSRTVTAQITNTGTTDAHNVWVKVAASIAGSNISLDGQDYLRVDIGTLKAGDSVTKQATLNFSVTDGLKIALQGVHLDLTIFSDERSQTFSYDYEP